MKANARSRSSGYCVLIITREGARSRNSGKNVTPIISIHTEILILWWSRNYGPVLSMLPNADVHTSETLDTLFGFQTKASARSRSSGYCVLIITRARASSRNSGNVTWYYLCIDYNESKGMFQKFWKCYSDYFFIQKFCGGPEIMDQFFRCYRMLMCTLQKL
jgi:hypothetical protein